MNRRTPANPATAAALLGIGSRYVSDAKRLRRENPELFEAVRSGEKSLPEAMRACNKRADYTQQQTQDAQIANRGFGALKSLALALKRFDPAAMMRGAALEPARGCVDHITMIRHWLDELIVLIDKGEEQL